MFEYIQLHSNAMAMLLLLLLLPKEIILRIQIIGYLKLQYLFV